MIHKKGFWHSLIFIFLALVLAGSILMAACGDDDETPTPTVTKTAVPTTVAPTTVAPTTAAPTTAAPTAKPTTAAPTTAAPTTAVPTTVAPTAQPTGATPPVPVKPAGWQELPDEQKNTFKVSFYFPGEWITMTSQPLPTIILCLDPTFFPNCELRTYEVPEGTTNAQFRDIIKNKYPTEKGGEYDGFTVLEEGDITLSNGYKTVYMIHKGTRMGYGAQAFDVFLVRGTDAFILQCGDYPVTFEDYRPLAEQIAKTLYSTIAIPGAEPTTAPTTAAPTTAAPTTAAPTTAAPTGGTIPAKPAGWQELPDEQKNTFKISYYFPGEWITMTSQPLPTIILCLDPTFFPNSELRMFDVAEGTTAAQFRDWIKQKYPSENGGEYDGFTVLEEGDITLDSGVQTVYLIYKGTRMGYGAQAMGVCLVRGTQGFILTGGDYPITFEDSQELLTQIVKTIHFVD